jgi:carbamoyl-phosphate synthase small subunit
MNSTSPALLVLVDGTTYAGYSFGAPGERIGEVVFNTSITGYQEILTDPSYKGQIVVMTATMIGNYGVNPDDVESRRPFVEGFVVREDCPMPSNWRSQQPLGEYLAGNGIPGISDIDTRALTRRLRDKGAMNGIISTVDLRPESLLEKVQAAPRMVGLDLAQVVSCVQPYAWTQPDATEEKWRVVVYDFGVKYNILRSLRSMGCAVTVVPARTPAADVLALHPHGVVLSNGPGDPEPVTYGIDATRDLLGRVPVFGICLGHQILGLALGGKTYKLQFGHHGGNHPVKNMLNGQVEITAQNHGFGVDPDSFTAGSIDVTHVSLNDNCCEGLRHRSLPAFSVQYHPEASPGPHDSRYLFDQFLTMMSDFRS